ncbi:MAG TPA: iron-containing redox enzyme family protein [Actinomycetota bacterium]|nr:iron-containing redox enzyme family protein [Actinomycetota bacterium]
MGIDRMIDEQHLLTHPFYQRWQKGKVSLDVLRSYAVQYYAYESALPSFLQKAMAHFPDGPVKASLADNLQDEAGGAHPHPELWLRFAESLGLRREDVEGAELMPRTANLVYTYESLCDRGAEEALAALYAYEAQFPAVAASKGEGLRRFYGITDPAALEFFDVHSTLDHEHAASLRSGLVESEQAREAAALALDAWWGMLDSFEAMS